MKGEPLIITNNETTLTGVNYVPFIFEYINIQLTSNLSVINCNIQFNGIKFIHNNLNC